MAKKIKATTQKILNNLRYGMDAEYQIRIPKATQANLREIAELLSNDVSLRNRLIPSLLNKVGLTLYREGVYTNPLAPLKIGMMRFGDSIEEIHTNLVRARTFDPDHGDTHPLGRFTPDTEVFYHTSLPPRIYPISIDDNALLDRGFRDETSLGEYMQSVMNINAESAEWDDYLISRETLTEFANANMDTLYKVQIPDVNASGLTDPERTTALKQVTEQVRAYSRWITFRSRLYNPAGRDAVSKFEDLIIFTTPDYEAALDVNVLAFAFNMSMAELKSRVIILDKLPIPDVKIILMDSAAMILADKRIDTSTQFVASGFYTNYFLLHDMIASMSRVSNMVLFTLGQGTPKPVITFTISGIDWLSTSNGSGVAGYDGRYAGFDYIKNETYTLNLNSLVEVQGSSNIENLKVPQGVEWEIVRWGKYTSTGTTTITESASPSFEALMASQITPQGLLIVGAEQFRDAQEKITLADGENICVEVKGTSVEDSTKSVQRIIKLG